MKFKELGGRDFTPPSLCGTHFNRETMEWHYNIGLRHHSATIILESKHNHPNELLLHIKIFGQARGRWPKMILLIQLMDYLEIIKLQNLHPATEQEMSFTWSISDSNQISLVWEELERLLCFTMEVFQENYIAEFYEKNNHLKEKMGEFFFLHPHSIKDSWGNHVECLNSYFATNQGQNALEEMSQFGISLDPIVRQNEIERLKPVVKSMSFMSSSRKLPELIEILKIVLPRYVDKRDNLSSITSIFQLTQMHKLGNDYCQKYKDSRLNGEIQMVKEIYINLLYHHKQLYISEAEKFATHLITFEDKEILLAAGQILLVLVKNNHSIEQALECVQKLQSFKINNYLETSLLERLLKELKGKIL